MAKREMVTLIATALANVTVRGENARYNVHTNPDDPDAAVLSLERKIAVQLVAAGVGTIEGEDPQDTLRSADAAARAADAEAAAAETDGTGRRGGTVERIGARRLRRSLEADNAGGRSVSGADSRDTTAHRRNPLGGAERGPGRAEAPESDEPPLDGAEAPLAPGATRPPPAARVQPGPKTPAARRRVRKPRGKKAAADAAPAS